MKKLLLLVAVLMLNMAAQAQEFKTYENKAFSIEYPADWKITWDSYTFVNMATEDEDIHFDISFNEEGPMKAQLQDCVENWELMKKGQGHKIDQKLVRDDYALVRSIETNNDDGKQNVVVWFIMISSEAQGYAEGGFTRPGRVDEVAGVVHAGNGWRVRNCSPRR
ncbi:MAG: hypothetical protein IJP59_03980 [Muribaculaceae bacterium]|nr:hypothetical protein [Muribaculaceae bacterium]